MKDTNLPDDIKNKTLDELTELANNIIKNLENKKNLEDSLEEYQKLIKLNIIIENQFQKLSRMLVKVTKYRLILELRPTISSKL